MLRGGGPAFLFVFPVAVALRATRAACCVVVGFFCFIGFLLEGVFVMLYDVCAPGTDRAPEPYCPIYEMVRSFCYEYVFEVDVYAHFDGKLLGFVCARVAGDASDFRRGRSDVWRWRAWCRSRVSEYLGC